MTALDDHLAIGNIRHAVARLTDAAEEAAFACDPPGGCAAKRVAYRVFASLRLALVCLKDAEGYQGELARITEGCDAKGD